MTTVRERLSKCFANGSGAFAACSISRRHAAEYLSAILEAGLTWRDVEEDVRAYGQTLGWRPRLVLHQVHRVRSRVKPWL